MSKQLEKTVQGKQKGEVTMVFMKCVYVTGCIGRSRPEFLKNGPN